MPVDAPFDLLYLPHAENAGEGEVEVEDDDLTTAFYRDDEIDLGQLMREQFYLALPMKPLCREACQGLCPQCGTNLNSGTCDCARVDRPSAGPRLRRATGLIDPNGAASADGRIRPQRRDSMPNPKRRHSKTRDREAPHPRRAEARRRSPTARSATSRSCRTRCARTAGTTAGDRSARSRKS